MKKSTRKLISFTVFVAVLCIVTSVIVYNIQRIKLEAKFNAKIEEQNKLLEDKKKIAYVAIKGIKVGEKISKDNTEKRIYLSDSPQEFFLADNDLGKIALVKIKKNQVLFKNMTAIATVDDTVREQEFTEINLSANLKNRDLVDVRLVYPNGESFVVLSQKAIKSLVIGSNACYFDLDAEELDLIQSAFVDAYINKASLYTVKYVQESLVDGSITNYTPSVEVIDLIKNDPNITKVSSKYLSETARQNLETRLNAFRKVLANRQLEEKQQEKKTIETEQITDSEVDESNNSTTETYNNVSDTTTSNVDPSDYGINVNQDHNYSVQQEGKLDE